MSPIQSRGGQNERRRDIADAMFTQVPEGEKKKFAGIEGGDPGTYCGYHLRGHEVRCPLHRHFKVPP